MMSNCPKCGSTETRVVDSRPRAYNGNPTMRRRRECISCNERYSTYEFSVEFFNSLEETGGEKVKKLVRELAINILRATK